MNQTSLAIAMNECVHIPAYMSHVRLRVAELSRLRSIHFGHKFGRDCKCACGMEAIEFYAAFPDLTINDSCPGSDLVSCERISE